jgi:PKD repeat protein
MKNYFICTTLRNLFARFLSAALTLLLFSGNLFAANLTLSWNASTSPNVGGYKLSYGQSSNNFTSTIDVGNTNTYTLTGLQEGTTYYLAAKAYDTSRSAESDYSNEVNMTVPDAAELKAAVPVETTLTADFTETKTSGVQGMSTTFTPVTTGTVTSWQWTFTGSYTPSITNSTAQAVTVSYPTSGSYSVSLTAIGPKGSVTKTYPNLINVTATPLIVAVPRTITTPSPISPSTITRPPVTSVSQGLVAAYGFEEISDVTVADASGKANHGTIKEAVSIPNGHSGRALQFDGENDWVTVNNSASLDLSTGMTLEAWVYPTALTDGGKTVVMKENSETEVYSLYASEDVNQPISYVNDGNYRSVSDLNPLQLNQWTHIVTTYDGLYQRLYIGGKEVAKSKINGQIQQSTGALHIGGNSLWGEFFKGYIDEVRIYNRALTVDEVNYNLQTAISVSNPSQFVMGDKTLEPWVDFKPQGVAQAYQTTPPKTGVITTVQVYLDVRSTATELVAGIYNDTNGHPGTLVAQGKLSTLKPGAWNSVPIPVISVTAAQPYWIVILGSKGQIRYLDRVGSGKGLMETSTSRTLTSLPSKWQGSAYKTNSTMSVYGKGY